MKNWVHSISTKMVFLIFFPVVLLFVYLTFATKSISDEIVLRNIQNSIETYSQTINLAVSLHFGMGNSPEELTPFLSEFIGNNNNKGIQYLAITNELGETIAATDDTPDLSSAPLNPPFTQAILKMPQYHVSIPVLLDDNSIGALHYGVDTHALTELASAVLRQNLSKNIKVLWALAIAVSIVSISVLWKIKSRFNYLIERTKNIASGQYGTAVTVAGSDELAELSQHFESMRLAIQLRVAELQQSENNARSLNADLSDTLEKLKHSQQNLVQSEKLAGLGSVVAAVAHELNTPIGNALGVSTTLQEKLDRFRTSLQTGLKKSTLDSYITDSEQALGIINQNIYIAADLIESFKHVAVDQTSSKRRVFALHETVEDILKTLRPTFKNLPLTIINSTSHDIQMDSFPGALGQVVTNLVNNAVIHAFDPPEEGNSITILTEAATADHIRLVIADNGKGISKANLGKIFDPFYTTRLGKGGSGLGLHIVYNLTSGILGGNISVESIEGKGTKFILHLPLCPQSQSIDYSESQIA